MRKRPTLLLLHGGPGHDHSAFKPELAALADWMQVVFFDQRGMGRSDRRPAAEWTLDVWADDVVALCAALEIEHPLVLGASFGSMVADPITNVAVSEMPKSTGSVLLLRLKEVAM